MAKYKRILLKLSGESLMGDQQYGIDQKRLNDYAVEIAELVKNGIEIASSPIPKAIQETIPVEGIVSIS